MIRVKIVLGLYLVLLGYITRAKDDSASIFIDGGPTFEEGDTVVIRCYLTGFGVAFNDPPDFNISGVLYDASIVRANLTEYIHSYTPGLNQDANYTLTLLNASASYNGTTYQCIGVDTIFDQKYPSGEVTLFITESTGSNTTNNMSANTPDTPTPAPTPSTATPAPTPTTAKTPPEEYDEVELLIDGGTTFKVGTTAVIRCHYTGLIALSPPHFSINGRFYNSDNLKMALPRYQHAYNSGIEGDVLWANYSLTLPSVQISDNGTSYQCSVDPIDLLRRYHSNTVILMVVEPPTAVSPQDGSRGVVEVWHVVVPIVIVVVVAAALGAVCILIKASTVSNATNDRPHTIEDNKSEGESAGSTEMKAEANGEGGGSTARETVYTEFNEETQFLE